MQTGWASTGAVGSVGGTLGTTGAMSVAGGAGGKRLLVPAGIVVVVDSAQDKEEEPAPLWWALIDSGLLSTSLFLLAMVFYLWAIPEPEGHFQSNLFLVGALLFVAESGMDLFWAIKRWRVEIVLARDKKELQELAPMLDREDGPGSAALLAKLNDASIAPKEYCMPWLDDIHWDVWAALFFFIPAMLYLLSSFLDPNLIVLHWLNVMSFRGMSDQDFSTLVCQIAAWMFVFDATLGVIGKITYVRTEEPEDRLILYEVWRLRSFFELDWAAWGDAVFLIGSFVAVYQQYDDVSVALDWVSQGLWALDALFYVISCIPGFVSMLRTGS